MPRLCSLPLLAAALLACEAAPDKASSFPPARRDVAPIVSDAFSTEDVRDRVGEFEQVVEKAGIRPGMWVADVGAGEGYYTVRLAPVVGAKGRVLAQGSAGRIGGDDLTGTFLRLTGESA